MPASVTPVSDRLSCSSAVSSATLARPLHAQYSAVTTVSLHDAACCYQHHEQHIMLASAICTDAGELLISVCSDRAPPDG